LPDDVFVDFDNNLNAAMGVAETLGDSAEHPRFIETLPACYRFLAKVTEALRHRNRRRRSGSGAPFLTGGIAEKEYFSDAMTDELITELARTLPEQLAVIARTTAMHYKESGEDVARIARELDVDYVVEGGVHQADNRFRMTAQLIRTADQAHVWAERYEAEMGEIFMTQARVAQAIVEHIPVVADAARASGVGRASQAEAHRGSRGLQ
jgi:TolB-like protein